MPNAGRVALVTGGGKGLGETVARALHADGARLAILGRDKTALERVAGHIGAFVVVGDVADPELPARAVALVEQALGPIELLVQNAGIAKSAPLARTDDATWEAVFATNVTGPFRFARQIAPGMAKRGFGRIVHVASNAGLTGYAYTSAYCASKHALVGLTRALAAEFARTGVTVNAVCPGFLDTEMTARTFESIHEKTGRSLEEARKTIEDLSPQRRLIRPIEVAHVVRMLCADDAQAMNGQAIAIDGGQVMS